MPATYEPIASSTVSGTTTSTIFFTSIPATYTDLRLVIMCRTVSSTAEVDFRFNNDGGTNYNLTETYTNGSSNAATRWSSRTELYATNVGGPSNGLASALIIADIMNYSGSTQKSVLFTYSGVAIGSAGDIVAKNSGLWTGTSAINAITIFMGSSLYFAAGSTFTLYGIARA